MHLLGQMFGNSTVAQVMSMCGPARLRCCCPQSGHTDCCMYPSLFCVALASISRLFCYLVGVFGMNAGGGCLISENREAGFKLISKLRCVVWKLVLG